MLVKCRQCDISRISTFVILEYEYFIFCNHSCSFILTAIFVFTNAYEVLSDSHKYFMLDNLLILLFNTCMMEKTPNNLRCLSKGMIPVNLKLKNTIRTYKSDCIIYQAEM